MRRLILIASFWALVASKPEMYKEKEDFEYSRSSSDDGTKAGFYGAQRGNMGGNYERAHNMDTLAQHQMSTLVRNVDGELGEGANTRTGSVFAAANSRGLYGSGNYDLSNLRGRNFGEGTISGASLSQSALAQNAAGYSGYSGYGSEYSAANKYSSSRAQSSGLSSGYQSSGLASQYLQTDAQKAADTIYGAKNYEYDSQGTNNYNYAQSSSQAQSDYENINSANSDHKAGSSLIYTTPVRVYVRPGTRIAIPVAAKVYDTNAVGLNTVHSDSELLDNTGQHLHYKPTNNAKHYESSYSYRKQWEKHDTIPVTIAPTEIPIPTNSKLYEDAQLSQTASNQYESELASAAKSHASSANNAYLSGYSASTKNALSSQSQHQSQTYNSGASDLNAYNYGTSASNAYDSGASASNVYNSRAGASNAYKSGALDSNAYTLNAYDASQAANLHSSHISDGTVNSNNLIEDIGSRPKSYHSSYSYHKSWERRGDPYIIKPVGEQSSQKLTSASAKQGYVCTYCLDDSQQRIRRSLSTDGIQQSDNFHDGQKDMGQQSMNGWDQEQDLGQQTESRWDELGNFNQQPQSQLGNLEDLGQQTQNQWDNLEDLGQQSQNQWGQFEDLSQQTQDKLEDLDQQTQSHWGKLEDLGQQAQNQWDNLGDELNQQTQSHVGKLEDLGQQTQTQWDKLGDLSQQTLSDKLEDLGQQARTQWDKLGDLSQQTLSDKLDDLGQQTQTQWDNLGDLSQTQGKLGDLGQQTQSHWGKLEDLGQQTQNKWDILGDKLNQQTQSHVGKLEDLGQQTQTQWNNVGDLSQQTQDKLEDLGQQTQSHWGTHAYNYGTSASNAYDSGASASNVYNSRAGASNAYKSGALDSNAYTLNAYDASQAANLHSSHISDGTVNSNNLIEDIGSRPKSYHSSYSYHKSWERRGDPYIIKPVGEQSSQKLTSASAKQGYVCTYCLDDSQQRIRRSLSTDGIQQSDNFHDGQKDMGQQSMNGWDQEQDLGQQTESRWDELGNFNQQPQSQLGNLEDLGQQTQNQWDNLEDLGQQSQNQWGQFEDLSQQTQDKLEDLDQQTQSHWGKLEDLGQQAQNQWDNLGDELNQQTQSHVGKLEDLGQQTQTQWDKLGDLSQQTLSDKLEDLGQQARTQWDKLGDLSQQTLSDKLDDLGQQTQTQWDNLGDLSQTQGKLGDLGQQTQSHWGKLEDLGQQTQNKWDILGDKLNQQTQSHVGKLEDLGQQTQTQWNNVGDLSQQTQDKLEDLGQQTQSHWGKLEDLGQQTQTQWDKLDLSQQTLSDNLEDFGQQTQTQWDKLGDLSQQTQSHGGKLEDLGQQTQNSWNTFHDVRQQSLNKWSNLDKQDLGQQQSQNEANFGQETQNTASFGGYQFYKPWTVDGTFVPYYTNYKEIGRLPYYGQESPANINKRWNCHNLEHGSYFHSHNFDFKESQDATHNSDFSFNVNHLDHSVKPVENTAQSSEYKPKIDTNIQRLTTTVNYGTLDMPVTTVKPINTNEVQKKNSTLAPIDIGRGDIGPEDIESLSLTKEQRDISEEPLNLSVTSLNQQSKPDNKQKLLNELSTVIESVTSSTSNVMYNQENHNMNVISVVDDSTPRSNFLSTSSNLGFNISEQMPASDEQQNEKKILDNFEPHSWMQQAQSFNLQNMEKHLESLEKQNEAHHFEQFEEKNIGQHLEPFEEQNLSQHLENFEEQNMAQQLEPFENGHYLVPLEEQKINKYEQQNIGQQIQSFDQQNLERFLEPFEQQNMGQLQTTQKSESYLQNLDKKNATQLDFPKVATGRMNSQYYDDFEQKVQKSADRNIAQNLHTSSNHFETGQEKINVQENKQYKNQNYELPKSDHISTPIEPTTEKPGFWGSVWNKTKSAKDSVVSWFSS